jgi:hypothetical protein
MYGNEHPPTLGGQHPWTDPLAPQSFLDPRPDTELAIAGALAPRPEHFPFTESGRADYYAAVRVAAQQQTMMQHQAMHHASELADAERREANRKRAERQALDANLLLIL